MFYTSFFCWPPDDSQAIIFNVPMKNPPAKSTGGDADEEEDEKKESWAINYDTLKESRARAIMFRFLTNCTIKV